VPPGTTAEQVPVHGVIVVSAEAGY
jgi:hypothetical protein